MDRNKLLSFTKTVAGYLAMTVALLGASSCENDDLSEEFVNSKEVAFVLESQTKTTQNNTFEKGDAIGIFAFVRSDNETPATLDGNYANNKKWVWNGSEFVPESVNDRIFFSGSKKMDFYVYYPYSSSLNDPQTLAFSTNLDQSTTLGYTGADFMTAVNATGIYNQSVSLSFKHRLATVRLMVEDLGNIQGVVLNGVKRSATFRFSDKGIVTSTSGEDVLMNNKGSKGGYFSFDACVPVQDIPGGKQLFTVKRTDAPDILIKSTNGVLQEGMVTVFNVPLRKTITINQTVGGTAVGGGSYPHGYSLSLTAMPNGAIGYSFEGWYENGIKVSSDASYTFTVTAERVLEPRYSKIVYSINATSNASEGTVSGGGSYNYNDICTLIQTSSLGYTAAGWYENGVKVSVAGNYSFPVQVNRNIEARFTKNLYSLTVVGGTGSGNYAYGTDVVISATVPANKTFARWADGNTNTVRTVKVTSNVTYTAEFNAIAWVYNLTVTPTYMTFLSKGGTKSFTVISTRTDGTTTENVAYTSKIIGTGAGGFSLSGTSVSTSENTDTVEKTANLVIQQTDGKTFSVALVQEEKVNVDTEIP